MYSRVLRNDIRRSKTITVATTMFVAAAAMLVSLAATLVVNLSGAVDTLMTQAKTSHFLQMHAGEPELARLAAFAEQNEAVADFQALEFLNLDGAQILFESGSLAGSVQDNGLAVQSERFDFLLDLDGNLITVSDGQVYVPITYMQDRRAEVGERVVVAGKAFTIAGFLRDSQMNSLLSSSKRFLVSPQDFAALKPSGSVEYLIEFRLKDLSMLGAFEADYTSAGLPANGPTATYPLFRMLNALADGMMAALLLLVSALVTGIAFLCIRFTLLAKIEDDYREIGVMKAIGLRVSDIKRIYLAKYAALAAAGCLLGFALSLVFRGALLENIRLAMGESENAALAPLLGILGVLLLFFAVVAYVNGVLRRFRRISPAEAIRFGTAQQNPAGARRFRLATSRLLGTNVFLGIKDVLSRTKLYATMLVVLVLAAFIIIVPRNLHNTISSKDFSAYMGIGKSDIRIDIQQTDHIADKSADIAQLMANDPAISRYVVLTTRTFRARLDDGAERRLMVELGDHSVFPINYAEGRAPAADDEIALSVLNADAFGKKVGEAIPLIVDGREKTLTVSGIYSDVTNGGKTAKAVLRGDSAEIMWSVINVELADAALVDQVTRAYAQRFPFAKVSDIDEFVAQTFGGTVRAVETASLAAIVVALVIAALITLLFMRMLVAKDRYSIAVMKAFGFTSADVAVQYVSRSMFVLLAGILLGTILANTLGKALAGAAIASFGAARFDFTVNPLFAYVLAPVMMTSVVLFATLAGALNAGRIKIAEFIKE
ncbi:MAG: FtsX-like permease family protein [Spirochaetales bacterium]|nr:FtsX-like permease family protein [Spirochaetales bacterium]